MTAFRATKGEFGYPERMGSPQDNQRASFPITATILTATGILMVLFSLQGQERMDTLRHAESLAYGGELGLATDLCSAYCDGHPRDVQSLRTCGRIAYWAGRLRLAERMLTNAYEQAPQDERLLAEYLEILARTGRLARARAVERALPTTLAPEAALSRSRALIAYYSGEPGQARQFMKAAMEGSTGNQENIRLAAEIEEAGSPLLVAGISLMKDDQPLGGFRPALGYSQHVKSWLNPGIQVEFPFWISDTRRWHSAQATLSNELVLADLQLRMFFSAGYSPWPADGTGAFIADLKLEKQFLRRWKLTTGWDHRPYLSTLSSIDKKVIAENLHLALGYGSSGKWNGEIKAARTAYPDDDNAVNSLSAWILSAPFTQGSLKLSAGYGYSCGQSLHDRFQSVIPLEQSLGPSWSPDPIAGRYDPYFTPRDLSVHAALAVLDYRVGERFTFSSTLNYGIFAAASHPYLYLDRADDGSIFLARGFADTRFHPAEVRISALFRASARYSLHWEAVYAKTLYYSRMGSGLQLKVHL